MTNDYPLLDSIDSDGTNLFVNLRLRDGVSGKFAEGTDQFARINVPGTDERDSIYLSFPHGAQWPVLYLYEQDREEPAYVLFLSTAGNSLEKIHLAKDPKTWHSRPEELIERAESKGTNDD